MSKINLSDLGHLNPTVEAAVILNCSPRTLERQRLEGRGPRYVKLGGKVFYPDLYLTEHIISCTRESTTEAA